MNQRNIAIVTESRATYGYVRRLIQLMKSSTLLRPEVVITGMHLLKEFGSTMKRVEADGAPVAAKVDMMIGGDTAVAWAKSLGLGVIGLAQAFDTMKADLVLVAGDRGEGIAATMAATYMNVPVAHIQGGDLSGHVDGSARHAITKLAHVHFPSCADSADRVLKLGEEPWRVHNVGAPQLDDIVRAPPTPPGKLEEALGEEPRKPFLLVIQHTVLAEIDCAFSQMIETLEAIRAMGLPTIVIYSNNDAGGQEIIRAIRQFEQCPFVYTHPSLDRAIFIALLRQADCIVGNSSCGILEAPSFGLPAVNIGNRQAGRMQADNVINVPHDRNEIERGIRTALTDERFRARVARCSNPYGDGHSSERILHVLESVELGARLLDKRMTY